MQHNAMKKEQNPLERLLFYTPLCPFSRSIRLGLFEKQTPCDWWEERPGHLSKELYALSPEGSVPVLVDQETILVQSYAIIEHLDENYPNLNLMGGTPQERGEVRRLIYWFNEKLFYGATKIFLSEKVFNRSLERTPPNSTVLKEARKNLHDHLEYIGWLFDRRSWLAYERLSWADLVAAAQLSCIDYLGDVPWNKHQMAKNWYSRIKSRPSFRSVLMETFVGISPCPHYRLLDF